MQQPLRETVEQVIHLSRVEGDNVLSFCHAGTFRLCEKCVTQAN